MRDGITIHCYLPCLTDDDLECLRQLFMLGADWAPVLSFWMVDLMTAEQFRRLVARTNRTPIDVDPVVVPAGRMTNRDIADALLVVTCVSFAAELSPAGSHLLDEICHAVNGIAAVRLSKEASHAGGR